jgi:hypothetical protein
MPKCPKCGTHFEGARCPACGETARASVKVLNKQIHKYSYLLLAGLFGILIADYFYPPLDENPPVVLGLCLFFLPILMQIVLIAHKRLPPNVDRLRRVYFYSGSVVVLIAVFLGLNGAADFYPARQVQTSITRKYVSRGKTTSYHLVVSSWRPGRDEERFRVSSAKYQNVYVGEPIVVEVHPGLFTMPWYGRISPQ